MDSLLSIVQVTHSHSLTLPIDHRAGNTLTLTLAVVHLAGNTFTLTLAVVHCAGNIVTLTLAAVHCTHSHSILCIMLVTHSLRVGECMVGL